MRKRKPQGIGHRTFSRYYVYSEILHSGIEHFFNGAAQLDMVARKDSGGRTAVFSESLYRLFTEEP